ncbi:MAG: GNAT family N-acetyltransferase [Bryobacter sp.]|nr:GNAT family N-acetyltransferase [Bryobacter sp.]
MSSKETPTSAPRRGNLEYFLSARARTDLSVVTGASPENLAQLSAENRPAALLLGPQTFPAEALAGKVVLGPGSLGVAAPHQGIQFLGNGTPLLPGKVALITQSAGLGAAVLDWAQQQRVGFSAFLSLGQSPTLELGEAIDFLAEDPFTKSILIYFETITNAAGFLSAARECALHKPVIVLRAGRDSATEDAVYDAAFRRCGVLRVERLADLFYMAEVLDRQPRPEGNRLGVVTNARGPALLAVDTLLAAATLRSAGGQLAAHLDIGAEAGPADYEAAVSQLLAQPECDGVLTICTPQPQTQPAPVAAALAAVWRKQKPLFASFLGGPAVREANEVLAAASIATFPYPDTAVRAFLRLSRYAANLRALYETPIFAAEDVDASALAAELVALRQRGIQTLEPAQCARLLEAYGIPYESREARVTQPLRLRSEIDSRFGPVLFLSAAGFGEDYYGDLTATLPPLNSTLARRFVERLRIHEAFRDATLRSLEVILVRFSRLVTEKPIVRSFELHPLCAESGTAWVGGARAVLQPPELAEALWPRSVIRPYPSQYVTDITLRNGESALLRPIRPEDESMVEEFHHGLSEQSVYSRYLQFLKFEERVTHERLARVCFNDYSRELALVVVRSGRLLGVGRLQRNPLRPQEAEVAFLVRDQEQGKGIGRALVEHLVAAARAEGLAKLTAELFAQNFAMKRLLEEVGFKLRMAADGQTLLGVLSL